MAAVVAATALKGRGARNARVLRGKERGTLGRAGAARVSSFPPTACTVAPSESTLAFLIACTHLLQERKKLQGGL